MHSVTSVADPGFPVGGEGDADPLGGGAPTSDMDTFQQKMYAKTKELGPIGGRGENPPLHIALKQATPASYTRHLTALRTKEVADVLLSHFATGLQSLSFTQDFLGFRSMIQRSGD